MIIDIGFIGYFLLLLGLMNCLFLLTPKFVTGLNISNNTVPTNTLGTVDSIIDPLISGPGTGLPAAVQGQRYLILQDIGAAGNSDPASAWGPLVAQANDIIEFNDGLWGVSFKSSTVNTVQFVSNLSTSIQYKWTGTSWMRSYEGLYAGGEWALVL